MKVFLIGLPGSGKTTLGRQIAELQNKEFVDLDEEIVRGERQRIVNIFQKLGESRFRELEKQYLEKWCLSETEFVMATGGGTPCYHQNIELINTSGISVFLDEDVSKITKRMLSTELAKRPLFAGQDPAAVAKRIRQMKEERLPFYRHAKLTFSSPELKAKIISDRIRSLER